MKNMSKKNRIVSQTILIIALSCLAIYPMDNFRLRVSLDEILSIGTLDDDRLFMWVGISVDENGFIYVSDGMDYSIKKFDTSGNLIKKTGRKGQGPGEFLSPRSLDLSDRSLYILDQNIPGINVFDIGCVITLVIG